MSVKEVTGIKPELNLLYGPPDIDPRYTLKPASDEAPGVQSKLTERLTGAVPNPESGTVKGELVALLTTLTLPEKLPLVVGANAALKEVACPAASVSGNANPMSLKPVPLTLICERVTLEFPVFVNVTFCVAVVPVVVLPKFSEVGDELI